MSAEMALGHLNQLFERVLGRRVAVSIMQVKDAPPAAAPAAAPRPSAPAPTPVPQRQAPAPDQLPPRPAAPVAAPTRALSPAEIDAAKAHPLVIKAGELLNAKVVRINARPDAPKPTPPQT